MESLKLNENPDFLNMKDLVERLIKIEQELDPAKNFIANVYPNRNNLVMIEFLLRKNSMCALDLLHSSSVRSPTGDAISPFDAARCLRDYIRTSRFITGLHGAIKKAQEKFPGERIRILDAGCGPFALLSLATATQFEPEEVEYSLVDFHKQSIDNSRSIISKMGMENYFDKIIQGDAVRINLGEHLNKKPHIVVAEVMNTALMEEPQAAVTKNLVPQLVEGGMIVPENVTVSASLLTSTHKIELGKIISLTKEHILELLKRSEETGEMVSADELFTVPVSVKKAQVMLDTDVRVFGDQKLQLSDSFITRPFPIGKVNKVKSQDKIRVKVKFGGDRFDTKFSLE